MRKQFYFYFFMMFQVYIFNNEISFIYIYETLLHKACKSENVELVKYIISLNKFDINSKIVFFLFLFNKISALLFNYVLKHFFLNGIFI